MGPDYMRPNSYVSSGQTFINADDISGSQLNDMWWTDINDPLLPAYIDTLLLQNLNLRQAGARALQARARLGIQSGQSYPSIGIGGDASRTSTPFQDGFTGIDGRQYANSYTTQLETSWQIDLFGRIQRSVESAKADFEASIYDKDALIHSLIAQLINQRVAIAVDTKLLDLAKRNAKNRKLTLNIVERRYDLGVSNASLSDVLLAEENYTSVRADINEFQRRLTDNIYALDVLLSQLPGTTPLDGPLFPIADAPDALAPCAPAALLDRRPDLRASELRLRAANANIGVAIADLYPSLALSASAGFTGGSPNGLLSADQLATSIIGSITNRLFEGGALRANIDLQKAEAKELTYAYSENILNAIREVESALQAENELKKEVRFLSKSIQSIKGAQTIIEDRYANGIATLRDVLDTQQRQYQIQQALILRQQDKWNTRVALYLALGGDWLSDNPSIQETCLR
jgi:NodT family efflux transporter outer membrane factor (OMF) lipoprotein